MAKAPNDGGPAFPVPHLSQNQASGETTLHEHFGGMSLRDWFAGQALVGMGAGSTGLAITVEQFASQSYLLADAMLAERERGRS